MHLPSTRYHRSEKPRIIHTEEEHDALEAAGWRGSPADFDACDDDASDDATDTRANDDVNREAATPVKAKRKR
jgi:hypothetical protein